MLDAPVPFIAGVETLDRDNINALVLELDSPNMFYLNMPNVPPLPELKKLYFLQFFYHDFASLTPLFMADGPI